MAQLDIVGYIEIAERAGVQRPVVTMWRARHDDFPVPTWELAIGPIWLWSSVQDWLRATGRL